VLNFDPLTHTLSRVSVADECKDNPTFVARHPDLPVVYATQEMGYEKSGLCAFRVDNTTGTCAPVNV
jgi:6-phosphogluconolactonase (cycloisomerase 2 family)